MAGNNSYQYKYNGVEMQTESGMYAMDWRNYMPELGRFSSIDMLAESYNDSTPYHFAMNNPISYSDPSGMYSTDHNGNYSTTNTAEISKLQRYFGSGGSVEGVGSFISKNDVFKEDIQEVVVNVTGKGNKDTWNLGGNYLFNSYTLYNGILNGLNNWNFQTKANAMAESLIGMRNDKGVMMIGGYGDPLGLYDIGGQVISTWKPENRYLAMGVGILAAVALKKPALAKVDAYAGVKEASAYLQQAGVPRLYRKQILESFEIETISLQTAGKSTYGLRFYGGAAKESGRYLFPTFDNLINRKGLALPPSWNSMSGIKQFQVAPGSTYIFGRAASQGGIYSGGSYQMYVNDLSNLIK